ncbi:hypothetical protein E2C01_034758 [Portunus trituberculatus]|uniref:Uncharacterized protein n=1 Tax=Portunus trituberculatus TaxID=210409 RepID=A0A5B7F7V8_PORTR|nr:hypothetical protein [Portunus trituberculatus]
MATSTLYQSSPLGSPSNSPRSCLYLSRPKADWHASFTKSTLPLVLRHHNGMWLSSTENTPDSSKEPSPPPQPETQSAPPMDVQKTKMNFISVSKLLYCHVCQITVKEQYFHHHLFFGTVQCDLCDMVCADCHTFAVVTVGVGKKDSSCEHSFSFSEDPYEYLLSHVSGGANKDVDNSTTMANKLQLLQYYVSQLIKVQLQDPWCTAIRQCKSRLLKLRTSTVLEPSKNIEFPQAPLDTNINFGVTDSRNDSLTSTEIEWDTSSRMAPERSPSPAEVQHKSQEETNEENGLLLSQTYDLEHLEQAVEYVQVEKQWNSEGMEDQDQIHVPSKPKKRRKVSHYKRTKGQRLTPHRKRRHPTLPEEVGENESDLVMEDVALPQDGYYLMVQKAIEECPMCYTSLSLDLCSVNVKTFLITVTCPECSLLIFIVPDLPGGLQIVTDSRGGNARKEAKQHNHPKARRIQPRDFFAK